MGGEEVRTVGLHWFPAVSIGVRSPDLSMCGVMDGDNVMVTPFRELMVPPPSSAFEVHVSGPACHLPLGWGDGSDQRGGQVVGQGGEGEQQHNSCDHGQGYRVQCWWR